MTFDQLISAIPEHFLDGSIQRLHEGEKRIGDSIAEFIYYELKETFDESLSSEEQVEIALDYLCRGGNDIGQAMGFIRRKFC